jgi:arylsulfatase A-like enzyme
MSLPPRLVESLRSVDASKVTRPHSGRARLRQGALAGVFMLILAAPLPARAVEPASHPGAAADGKPSDGAPSSGAPPNIVFIVLDTARADRMSYNGYPRLTTPYIDAFARDAVTYSNAHSVAPWTLPSHMSMFTGLLPGQHGATWRAFATPDNMTLGELLNKTFSLAEPARFLPTRLRQLGYHTVGFSSNAWVSRRTGFDQGFDAFYEMWQDDSRVNKGYDWLPPRVRHALLSWIPPDVSSASELDRGDGGQVLRKLREHVAANGPLRQPFFLFFNFIDPHYPYSPPPSWRYAYSDDRELGEAIALFRFDEMDMQTGLRPVDVTRFRPFYDAEINYVDCVVGRLLTWLREQGVYDDALVVVTSDHGEHLGEGGHFSHQFSVEEELLRVPLVIKYPGNAGKGEVVDNQMVSNIDIYETLLRAAGAPAQAATATSPQDLAHMEVFSRPYLIAEEYYSLPYLRLNNERNPDFSVDDNRITRRVVYDPTQRHEFFQRDGVQPAAVQADDPDRAHAAAFLESYVSSLRNGMLHEKAQPLDAATRERLRSLGYVH